MQFPSRIDDIKARIAEIDSTIADLQNERIGLVDELQTLQLDDLESRRAGMTIHLRAAGLNDEAIEAALATQFGGAFASKQESPLESPAEPKRRRSRTPIEGIMKSVCDALTTTPQLSKDIRNATGLEKHQVLRALHELIKQGVVATEGATNSAKYWLKENE